MATRTKKSRTASKVASKPVEKEAPILLGTVSIKLKANTAYSAQGIEVMSSKQYIIGETESGDVLDTLIAETQEKLDAYAEENFDTDEVEEEELEEEDFDDDEEEEVEDDDEDFDDDEEDDDDEDDDDEVLTEDDIMGMKKAELLELIEEEELDIEIKGLKIKELKEEIIDQLFGEEPEDEDDEDEDDEDVDDEDVDSEDDDDAEDDDEWDDDEWEDDEE